ncbi:MAG TPA: hypothetical protein VE464_10005 [Streptosporangiaceae bacterium]|jgi:hypothetical protein|nr:hypothetical protein [Streptosporangiaceae bacterium]
MSSWFSTNIVQNGRLPLFCFFCAFVAGFGFIRLSVRLIRAQVRWWPGNVTPGDLHVHHMVFGVVFMLVGGVTGIVAPGGSLNWRAGAAALFGLGAALVLDEFALILHLRDVYWTSDGRLSVDAVFVAVGVTVLLLLGIVPSVIPSPTNQHTSTWEAVATLIVSVGVTLTLASITLLKGKIWTGLLGLFLFPFLIVGAIRLARPGSPWARWRYQHRPRKRARAARRERRFRQPVIRFKVRIEDLLSGLHDKPDPPPDAEPDPREAAVGRRSDDG